MKQFKEGKNYPDQSQREVISRIYSQLTNGCGRINCNNPQCASNPIFKKLTPEEASQKSEEFINDSSFIICAPVAKIDLSQMQNQSSPDEIKEENLKKAAETFGDLESLEIAFLLSDTDMEVKANPSKNTSSLNFDKINQTYQLLLESEAATKILDKSIAKSCEKFCSFGSNQNKDPIENPLRKVRTFLILFLVPTLCFPENRSKTVSLLKGITNLMENPTVGRTLKEWLSKMPADSLVQMLETVQTHLTIEMSITKHHYSNDVSLFLLFIDVIYEANKICKVINYKQFYNDMINENLMSHSRMDYEINISAGKISLLKNHYLLDTAVKSRIIMKDNERERRHIFQSTIFDSLFGTRRSPYLTLNVQRDTLVRDALTQLQNCHRNDLKRQLRVVFRGEYGVDEGGLKKEFFQLIVHKLFDPDYGMFEYNKETRTYWFNQHTMEFYSEFELIGIIIGIAIYNNVILNLHFPEVVYMKLQGQSVFSLEHLASFDPELAKGLKNLLEFEGDVESTFMRTFSLEFDVYGATKVVELKPGGKNIPLKKENREEYVRLYIDYVLNQSVKEQFRHFSLGFRKVCNNSKFIWFNSEQLELLICGSQDLDFKAFEKSCVYQDGYFSNSPTIKLFWEVIHEFSEEDKKKFLSFTTGSDRIPIRGLKDLVLTISRNGTNQKRLPSAHTCFNHLLLPEYKTKEVLKERLTLAINNAEGFGMI